MYNISGLVERTRELGMEKVISKERIAQLLDTSPQAISKRENLLTFLMFLGAVEA